MPRRRHDRGVAAAIDAAAHCLERREYRRPACRRLGHDLLGHPAVVPQFLLAIQVFIELGNGATTSSRPSNIWLRPGPTSCQAIASAGPAAPMHWPGATWPDWSAGLNVMAIGWLHHHEWSQRAQVTCGRTVPGCGHQRSGVATPARYGVAGGFELERDRLRTLAPSAFVRIEHFGSTAVPWPLAKQIIDILAEVTSLEGVDSLRRTSLRPRPYDVQGVQCDARGSRVADVLEERTSHASPARRRTGRTSLDRATRVSRRAA